MINSEFSLTVTQNVQFTFKSYILHKILQFTPANIRFREAIDASETFYDIRCLIVFFFVKKWKLGFSSLKKLNMNSSIIFLSKLCSFRRGPSTTTFASCAAAEPFGRVNDHWRLILTLALHFCTERGPYMFAPSLILKWPLSGQYEQEKQSFSLRTRACPWRPRMAMLVIFSQHSNSINRDHECHACMHRWCLANCNDWFKLKCPIREHR